MPALAERTKIFKDPVIAHMSVLSDKYGAVNLSAGFPDFPPPRQITERLKTVADKGPHQYSLDAGAENFRQALAEYRFKFTGRKPDIDKEIIATCGGTEALFSAIFTIINPGDGVIIFSPYYDAYETDVLLAGGEPVFVSLRGDEFTFDPDELEEAFKQRPKAVLLCDPSNPCGKVFSLEELSYIAELMRKYDTFAIVDEVYAHIIYKPFTYTYFSELPGMHERTVCVGSLSKTFSITGWRVGYIIGAAHIVGEIKKLHAYLTVSTASPLQEAAVAGLRFDRQYYEELTELYAKKETFSWAVLMISVLLIPFRRVPFTFFLTFPNTGIQVIRFFVRILFAKWVSVPFRAPYFLLKTCKNIFAFTLQSMMKRCIMP